MSLGEFFTLLGLVVGAVVLWGAIRAEGGSSRSTLTLVCAGFIGSAVAARLAEFVAEGWPAHGPAAAILSPAGGGRALLGGILGGWLAIVAARRYLGEQGSLGTPFALALPAGEAVGRIGCLFNGCCYGKACRLPWAIYQHGAWRHPAQVYASLAALVTLAIVGFSWKRGLLQGRLFPVYLAVWSLFRFVIEFTREQASLFLGLSLMQWLCLELCFGSVAWLIWARQPPVKQSTVAASSDIT